MPLSDQAQAIVVLLAAALMSVGTAAAAIPNAVPDTIKPYVFTAFWAAGIVGLALKEASGSTGTTFTISITNPQGITWTETNATETRIKALLASGNKVQIVG